MRYFKGLSPSFAFAASMDFAANAAMLQSVDFKDFEEFQRDTLGAYCAGGEL